jgi:putative transposase
MKIGQQKRIPAPAAGSKQRLHVIGAYNWLQDRVAWKLVPWKNSEHFIAFIEHLLIHVHPTGRIVLVMDNVSYHRSAATLAALSLFEHRVMLVWLPAYCSDLNLIERYWRHLKDVACANKLESDLTHLRMAVERALSQQNLPDYPDRFTLSKDL